ncbi:phage holin family protein [Pseudomonas jilinensis]|uniref:Phage holin family protein n=1 Tax=Pseudomonas jilinensis TaxID=2078689 RepID=A0A396RYZ7_9PSED|nr:phage holin family protein [Pseudomonas jilinensis]RHW21689.1 phage holin family protein [Pseudomonas jilinensis]
MHWLVTTLPVITILAYLAAALRLLCFNRHGYRYRRGVSLLASALIGVLLCSALDLVLHPAPVTIWQALLALLISVLVFRSRGNLAHLLRTQP